MSDMTMREKIAAELHPLAWLFDDVPKARAASLERADRILALIEADHAIVPKVATSEMVLAAQKADEDFSFTDRGDMDIQEHGEMEILRFWAELYTAVITAAPKVQP